MTAAGPKKSQRPSARREPRAPAAGAPRPGGEIPPAQSDPGRVPAWGRAEQTLKFCKISTVSVGIFHTHSR